MEHQKKQKLIDDEHLRLLSLAYLIDGCFTIVFACLFIFHFVFMLFLSGNPDFFTANLPQNEPVALEFFRVFAYMIGGFILLGILYGIAKICSSRFIKQRKHRLFSYGVAIPGFIFVPYGTILGIATLVVLGRQSVIDQYDDATP